MVRDNVGHGLGVGRRPGSAAPDGVVHLCQFVRHPVGNVGTGGCSTVGAQNNAILEVDCHAGGWLAAGKQSVSSSEDSHRGTQAGEEEEEMISMCFQELRSTSLGATHFTSPLFRWAMSIWMPSDKGKLLSG